MQVYNRDNQQDLYLVKALLDLCNQSVSKTAEAVGIQRTNLSAYLNGKQNVFSDQRIDKVLNHLGVITVGDSTTGVRFCDLDSGTVHKWYLADTVDHLITALESTLSTEELKGLEIFEVNTKPHGMFNLIRNSGENGNLFIILCNKDSSQKSYPLPADFKYGKKVGAIDVPVQAWIGWLKNKQLLTSEFQTEFSSLLSNKPNELVRSRLVTTYSANETKSHDAGLRAIIRALLSELRILDQHNKLLSKTVRDEIYSDAYGQEINKSL